MDDDCDGETDEDAVAPEGTCPILGVCIEATPACLGGDGWACNLPITYNEVDGCNNLDDDCDGETDEDFAPETCGLGACESQSTCQDGVEVACQEGDPVNEVCDEVDNDCDGFTDETNTWVNDRWVRYCNNTVVNEDTGLVWSRPVVTRDWIGAVTYCEELDLAGQTDWTLPDIAQLSSLHMAMQPNNCPDLFKEIWLAASCTVFWSSEEDGSRAKTFYYPSWGATNLENKGLEYKVRCIRNASE